MMSLGSRPRRRTSTASRPTLDATSALRPSSAGTMLEPIGLMPRTSKAMAIVFAVNWPPHAPAPGLATFSSSARSSSLICPGGVLADRLEDLLDRHVLAVEAARVDRAAVEHHAGDVEARERHDGAGIVLSQPLMQTMRVEEVAARDELDRVGDDLAADEAEVFIPLVPIVTPSEIATVLSSIGVPPASRMPSLTFAASARGEVAGHRLDPGVGDADDRLAPAPRRRSRCRAGRRARRRARGPRSGRGSGA